MNKKRLLLAIGLLYSINSLGQTISEPLPGFHTVHVGPLVKVVLQEGESEHIRIEYVGISPENIHYAVKGKKLRIYLDDAKYTVKTRKVAQGSYSRKEPIYQVVEITAYVTYKNLKALELRGEESLICRDTLSSKSFRIRQFGENTIDLTSLQTQRLRVSSFGENTLSIGAGDAVEQNYRLFGENKIYAANMYGDKILTSAFGENSLHLFASQQINVRGVGSLHLHYAGDPQLNRFVIGESAITRR